MTHLLLHNNVLYVIGCRNLKYRMPEMDLFSILSLIVIVSSSVICLNMQENPDGVCKYCVYVSVWLDMGEA